MWKVYRVFVVRSSQPGGGFTGGEAGRADFKPGLRGQKADVCSKELSHNEHRINTDKGIRSPIAVSLPTLGILAFFPLKQKLLLSTSTTSRL